MEVLIQDIGGVKQVLLNQHIDVLFYGGMLCRWDKDVFSQKIYIDYYFLFKFLLQRNALEMWSCQWWINFTAKTIAVIHELKHIDKDFRKISLDKTLLRKVSS